MPFVMVPVHFKECKRFHSFAGRDGVSYEVQQCFFREIHIPPGVVVISSKIGESQSQENSLSR